MNSRHLIKSEPPITAIKKWNHDFIINFCCSSFSLSDDTSGKVNFGSDLQYDSAEGFTRSTDNNTLPGLCDWLGGFSLPRLAQQNRSYFHFVAVCSAAGRHLGSSGICIFFFCFCTPIFINTLVNMRAANNDGRWMNIFSRILQSRGLKFLRRMSLSDSRKGRNAGSSWRTSSCRIY